LYLRSKNAAGKWSVTNRFVFYRACAVSNIVKAEYFLNNDPGFGNATNIPITPGLDVQNVVFTTALDTLPEGLHQLFVRSKNAAGKWSISNRFVFYRACAVTNIVKAEYFINNDPGFGNATDIPITPGLDVQNIVFTAALDTLPAGVHQLFVRSKNTAGKWSVTNRFVFNKTLVLPIKLLSFTGQLVGADGNLSWTIADNIDLSSFDVEHSIDGRKYNILGNVTPGATTSYKYVHANLADGVHYYRLNMKETSGKTAYSRVVILQRNRNITIINGLKFNVVKNEAIVNIISAQSQMVNMTLINTEGRIMWRQKFGLQKGTNDVRLSALFVPQGMYFLQATTADGVQATMKMMKQ
jgi:hypothetical protein